MVFFVAYSASERLYRSTSKCLVAFLGFFIIGQYYYSLIYDRLSKTDSDDRKFKWLSFYLEESKPDWTNETPLYFRHTPYVFEWAILFVMCMLNVINVLFINKTIEKELNEIAYENLRNKYPKVMLLLLRIRNYLSQYMIVIVICTMFYYICRA